MKFSDLSLEPEINSAIEKSGYLETTPVQAACIPHILSGRDVSGLAQTGTGKTAAFLIPLIDRILKSGRKIETPVVAAEKESSSETELAIDAKADEQKRSFQDWRVQNFILILVPTRELAEQVYENSIRLNEFSNLKSVAVYGGTGYDKQKDAFHNHVDFVVATPGRLIDLYKDNVVDLKQVRAVVFDEADRMFDMGFKDDMKYILQRLPRERQVLLFSATLNFDVLNTAYQFGAEPVEIDVSRDQAKAENVKDNIYHIGHNDKPLYLLSLLKKFSPRQTIIFSNFKLSVEKIAQFLNINGVPAMAISSLLTQNQRNKVIELFKAENEKNILVATDVAARGLDIKGVDLVINFELPNDAESYVHRIGRTGRAGAEGKAFSLVGDRDVDSLERIETYLKHKIEMSWLEETDLVRNFKPFPHSDNSYSNRPERPFRREFKERSDRGNNRGPDRGPDRGGDRGYRGNDRGQGQERGPDRGPRNSRPQQRGPRRDFGNKGPARADRPQGNRNENRNENQSEVAQGSSPTHQTGQVGQQNFRRGQNSNRPNSPQKRFERGPGGPDRHPPRRHGKPAPRRPHDAKTEKSKTSVIQKVKGLFTKLFK